MSVAMRPCRVHPSREGDVIEHVYGRSGPFCPECLTVTTDEKGRMVFGLTGVALNALLQGVVDDERWRGVTATAEKPGEGA